MTTRVVFIQGAGAGSWDADALLAESLRGHLGDEYVVDFPRMPDEDDPNDTGWLEAIGAAISRAAAAASPVPGVDDDLDEDDAMVLVGHSAGGYLLLKYLGQQLGATGLTATKLIASKIAAICIIAAPFPGGDPDWTFDGFDLPPGTGALLPIEASVFLYASPDDEIVPFAHRALFDAAIPQAVTRTTSGGHQLGNDLRAVASDIREVVEQ
jgi:predicted alpha/beta hydrolase family esterase